MESVVKLGVTNLGEDVCLQFAFFKCSRGVRP